MVQVLFKAPMQASHTDNSIALFSAQLNMTLDMPGPAVSLGCVELTAVAGTARLHTNKESLEFSAPPGQFADVVLPLLS